MIIDAKKFFVIALAGALSAAAQSAFLDRDPLEDGIARCGVPVCDVDKTVEGLSELGQNQRYNYANKLLREHGESADVKVLRNLAVAAERMKKLSLRLGDEDWVVREASNLADAALLGLAKHSEIKAKKLAALYDKLGAGSSRYEVIAHYRNKLPRVESLKRLSELVKFAEKARDISVAKGDEDWIPRAAEELASEATVKMVAMDPAHEGVYAIKTEGNDGSVLDVDKVIVLDSSSKENLVVNFVNTRLKRIVFSYPGSVISGDRVEGKMVANGSMSSAFEFVFDRESGEIEGTIQSTRAKKISFAGERVFSVRDVYQGRAPKELDENDALGSMSGEIMGVKGVLSVRSFSPGVFSASFVADRGELKIDYTGKFHPKRGLLSLTHKDKTKLALALREKEGKTMWRGVSFSIVNGKVSPAVFKPAGR